MFNHHPNIRTLKSPPKPTGTMVSRASIQTLIIIRATPLAVRTGLRQFGRVQSDEYPDAALVLLGHGTALNNESAAPVFQHAAELRRRGLFREVREAFWKQEPHIRKVLEETAAPRIFIVPLFISEGYFSTEIIPNELGFSFPETLTLKTQKSELHYCLPA